MFRRCGNSTVTCRKKQVILEHTAENLKKQYLGGKRVSGAFCIVFPDDTGKAAPYFRIGGAGISDGRGEKQLFLHQREKIASLYFIKQSKVQKLHGKYKRIIEHRISIAVHGMKMFGHDKKNIPGCSGARYLVVCHDQGAFVYHENLQLRVPVIIDNIGKRRHIHVVNLKRIKGGAVLCRFQKTLHKTPFRCQQVSVQKRKTVLKNAGCNTAV